MNTEKALLNKGNVSVSTHDIMLNGLTIHYVQAGSGPAVLMLHGLNMGLGQWYKNITVLAERFTVYALDLPGSGSSSVINFLTDDVIEKHFLDTVVSFIQYTGLTRIHIIGHSLGGWVALHTALKLPAVIDKLVLVDPLGFTTFVPWKFRLLAFRPMARLLAQAAMRPTIKNLTAFFNSVMVNTASIDPTFVAYFCEAIQRSPLVHPFYLIHRLIRFARIRKQYMLVEQCHQITAPVLVVNGDKDPLIPCKELQRSVRSFPSFSLVTIPNTGHVPPIENSEYYNELVVNFLRSW